MKKLLFILFLVPFLGFSQGYFFSQFHSSPLTLNPALNGTSGSNIRVSTNFRNQWTYGESPYSTGAIGVEARLLGNTLPEFHTFSFGANFLTDQSNAGGLSFNTINIGPAYHLALDAAGTHTIGIGLQGSFNQRMINLNNLNFESQFGSGGFNNALPVGETFQNLNSKYFDVNAGFLYQLSTENIEFNLGASIYNITQPENQAATAVFKIPRRYAFHSSFATSSENGLSVLGSLTSISVNGLNNITAGVAVRKSIEYFSITGGCWYRIGDAVIPYVGISKNGISLGISYDNTTSSLKTVTQNRNAFELSLTYAPISGLKELKRNVPWY
jgi:type IX secretion system PorP/SprF family membrane protein